MPNSGVQVCSIVLDADLEAELRRLANGAAVTKSELIRAALVTKLKDWRVRGALQRDVASYQAERGLRRPGRPRLDRPTPG